jgi:hypothetical protein
MTNASFGELETLLDMAQSSLVGAIYTCAKARGEDATTIAESIEYEWRELRALRACVREALVERRARRSAQYTARRQRPVAKVAPQGNGQRQLEMSLTF